MRRQSHHPIAKTDAVRLENAGRAITTSEIQRGTEITDPPRRNSLRIGLLNNLRAGRNSDQVNRLLGFLRRHPDVVHVETTAAHAVPEALFELARREVDLLVINGGDGTLQFALTEILANLAFDGRVPMIAPLKGGRTNMTASDLGAERDPVKGFAALLDDVENGRIAERIVPRRVLRVRHGIEEQDQYGMFFGLGVIHRATKQHHNIFDKGSNDRIQGALTSSLITAGLMGKLVVGDTGGILSPDKVQVLIDGVPQESDQYYLLIASSLERLFSGMRPFWGEGEGGVRYTSIASDAHRIGRAIPGILRGKPRDYVREGNGFTSVNGKSIQLRLDCGFAVDGELFDPQPSRTVELSADKTIRFVRT
jgi:diacylglycerol kinase (ATP)